MKRVLVAALLAASFSLNASADDASMRKAVEELLNQTRTEAMVSRLRSQLDGQLQQMVDSVTGATARESMTSTQKAAVQKFLDRSSAAFGEAMDWAHLKEFMIKTYSESFTESEIRELTAFYRSPIGQKAVDKMPAITEASMRNMRTQMQAIAPKLQAIGREFSEEYKKATPAASAPKATPAPTKKSG